MNKKQTKTNRRSKQNKSNKQKAIDMLVAGFADMLRWFIADDLEEFIPALLAAKFEIALDELQSAIATHMEEFVRDYKDIEEEFED